MIRREIVILDEHQIFGMQSVLQNWLRMEQTYSASANEVILAELKYLSENGCTQKVTSWISTLC